jgi:hypothetical protein
MATEETLVTKLNALGTVYHMVKPLGAALPCMTYQRISTQQNPTHNTRGLNRPRFQITCLASDLSGAKTLADSVESSLDLNRTDFVLSHLIDKKHGQEQQEGIVKVILDFYIFER